MLFALPGYASGNSTVTTEPREGATDTRPENGMEELVLMEETQTFAERGTRAISFQIVLLKSKKSDSRVALEGKLIVPLRNMDV